MHGQIAMTLNRNDETKYLRPDGLWMIEVAPHQFVNEISARALGLVGTKG